MTISGFFYKVKTKHEVEYPLTYPISKILNSNTKPKYNVHEIIMINTEVQQISKTQHNTMHE